MGDPRPFDPGEPGHGAAMLDTMNSTMLQQLAQPTDAPAVSIVCPLDFRRPGNSADPMMLRQLRDRAVEALDQDAANAVITRLDRSLAAIDLEHPSAGIAVFASRNVSRIVELDVPVQPRVTVGNQFAIRDLVTALSRSTRARAIVLSRAKSRCIDITDDRALERLDFGFPIEVRPPIEADTPHRDFPLDEHEHAEAAKFVFRAVDDALATLERNDERPLVLIGDTRDLAYFNEITHHHRDVIGVVHGNHERDTADALAEFVRPVVEEHTRRTREQARDDARETIGAHGVAGITSVWPAARAGRGHRLVVEADYTSDMRVVDDALVTASAADGEEVDAVDATIAEVLRHGGDVAVVAPGRVADLGHIVLVTRY